MKQKVIIFGILFLAIFITLAIIIRNKAKKYGIHTRDIPTALNLKMQHKKCDFSGGKYLIAHAGGGIIENIESIESTFSKGRWVGDRIESLESKTQDSIKDSKKDSIKNTEIYTYTNSKEALLQSISEGFKFIEIDLMLDSKGEIFGAHDYKHFYEITAGQDAKFFNETQAPTPEYIKSSKIHNKFSTLTLDSINQIFTNNPQIYLVTDKLNDFNAIKNQLTFQDRILVEVFGLGAYYAALRAGIKYPMLSSSDFALARKLGIPMMAAHTSALQDSKSLALAKEYIQNGGCIAVFSSNEDAFIESNLGSAATFIYTDFIDAKSHKCKLASTAHTDTCKTY